MRKKRDIFGPLEAHLEALARELAAGFEELSPEGKAAALRLGSEMAGVRSCLEKLGARACKEPRRRFRRKPLDEGGKKK